MKLFFRSLSISLFAIVISFVGLAGAQAYGLISVFIVAFFVHEVIHGLFEKNRINIVEKKMDSKRENLETFRNIFVMFLAIAVAYGAYMFVFSSPYLLDTFKDLLVRTDYLTNPEVKIADFSSIFITNTAIFVMGFVFSAIFKEYAVSLFVSLGAVSLGLSTGFLFSLPLRGMVSKVGSLFWIVLPGSLNIFSLVLLSVGTYFLVVGYAKHGSEAKTDSKKALLMRGIKKTFLVIFLSAYLVNFSGTVWESSILPSIIR